ncbi:reverse transcriptase family protein [Lysinibacillus sp. NPDC056959]|uniref:reverse transcriptase family protein n=1 Tax=Lysinibacillus sp. NPDC056959 TaxID=3345981 RepID=UPI00362F8D12
MDYTQTKFYGLSNKKYLAKLLYMDKAKLKNVSKVYTPIKFESEVNGKTRILYDQHPEYKKILKRIVNLLYKIEVPEYAFGGIKKRNYIDNAKVHKDNKFLLILDISNFFPSTSDSFVYNFFYHKLQMQPDIAKVLTNLVTVPLEKGEGRYLPQGFPTSPIMSLLTYIDMYEEIAEIAEKNNLKFSCYYDDFTLSSDKFISKSLKRSISRIIQKYGFKVHPKKSKLMIKRYTKVTGVIIEEGNIKAPKSLFKKLHEAFNKLKIMDKQNESYLFEDYINTCNKVQGLIAAIKSIEPNRNLKMYSNMLKYMRKKYDIPYSRISVSSSFKTPEAKLIGINKS